MSQKDPRICIVGAGMSGILMAIKLQEAGIKDFVMFEKASRVGGTWRENRYPGVACDVASFAYCYGFKPNPDWTHRFSPGPEIWAYFEKTFYDYGLESYIKFETEVTGAEFKDGQWFVSTSDGNTEAFDVYVAATGPLNNVKYPEIEGLDTFAGKKFHSAEWDDELDLTGLRVGLIGTGSSAVQMVDPIGAIAKKLTVFQRTAQWVIATPNPEYGKLAVKLKHIFPFLGEMTRKFYLWVGDEFGKAALKPGLRRWFVNKACEASLKSVKDPELRKKLLPPDEPMCRRMIMSGSFHEGIQRENVELEVSGISHIQPEGVMTKDGTLHELDVLVLATGFYPNKWNVKNVKGEHGKTIEEVWGEGVRTYKSMTVPGFPNYFILIGPNSPITNLSLVEIADIGVDYVMQCVEKIRQGELKQISPKMDVVKDFTDDMVNSFSDTVWVTGCNSWYLDDAGIPQTWPWIPEKYRSELKVLNLDHYDVVS